MKVFVVNCGSSSVKYQLFAMTDESVLAKGLLERIGTGSAQLHHQAGERRWDRVVAAGDHAEALARILGVLVDGETGLLADVSEIQAVGHRVVHGAEAMTGSRVIDADVLAVIRANEELAPLHNPPNLLGIEGAMAAMPNVPHVAVFDTAFLATLPPLAHRYAVPQRWYREHHVRKYGFHGTSHRYVSLRAAELLGRPAEELKLITVHLGNGCSMTAVDGGRAVDHSMGMTPLEGLMMGTRSGDIDPAIALYMQGRGLSADEADRVLNEESGLVGVSGVSNDMRDLLAAEADGNPRAALAVEMFVYRVAKYIGAYYVALGGADAVVLTGGIGENSVPVRERIVRRLAALGAVLAAERNAATTGGRAGAITRDEASLAVWVVGTNEELMIARDAARLAGEAG